MPHPAVRAAGARALGPAALLAAALAGGAGCFEAKGRILGELDAEDLGALAPICALPCDSVADCALPGTGPGAPVLCLDGRCVPVVCTSDEHCGVVPGSRCASNYCGVACAADSDCPDYREVCRDGTCFKPAERPSTPCVSDEECGPGRRRHCRSAENDYNEPLDPSAICTCAADVVCHQAECQADADCAGEYPFADARSWACVHHECVWRGCSSDADCQAAAMQTCDLATRLCTQSCSPQVRCWFRPRYAATNIHRGTRECVDGACAPLETCRADQDCRAHGPGGCRRPPDAEVGYCQYWFNGDEVCFSAADCPLPWQTCRASNLCDTFLSQTYVDDAGASCDDGRLCDARYLMQHLMAGGLAEEAATQARMQAGDDCASACGDQAPCGDGFRCVQSATQHAWVWDAVAATEVLAGTRTYCLPEACTDAGGCPSSLQECGIDADCPAGETCAFPISACAGVCLPFGCGACAAWNAAHAARECLPGRIVLDVVRAD